jgi:hypothetical protein
MEKKNFNLRIMKELQSLAMATINNLTPRMEKEILSRNNQEIACNLKYIRQAKYSTDPKRTYQC